MDRKAVDNLQCVAHFFRFLFCGEWVLYIAPDRGDYVVEFMGNTWNKFPDCRKTFILYYVLPDFFCFGDVPYDDLIKNFVVHGEAWDGEFNVQNVTVCPHAPDFNCFRQYFTSPGENVFHYGNVIGCDQVREAYLLYFVILVNAEDFHEPRICIYDGFLFNEAYSLWRIFNKEPVFYFWFRKELFCLALTGNIDPHQKHNISIIHGHFFRAYWKVIGGIVMADDNFRFADIIAVVYVPV